jgi:hypothetical protein
MYEAKYYNIKNMKKCLIWVVFGETLTPQRYIPNMKIIPSKLWFLASVNQTVSGGGRGQDQNQRIPDFLRGYND